MKFAPAVKGADFDAWNDFDAQFLAGGHGFRNPARDVVIRDRQRRDAGVRRSPQDVRRREASVGMDGVEVKINTAHDDSRVGTACRGFCATNCAVQTDPMPGPPSCSPSS